MGWRFRKSINFGPFRMNFSKKGIGYSVGGKGYRLTKKADGGIRQTISIPGTGISHVTESSNHTVSIPQSYQPKKKWTTFFLCLFLGPLGFHRFYVGKIGTGILWCCSAGVLCLGWIFDLVCILTGRFTDKYGLSLI